MRVLPDITFPSKTRIKRRHMPQKRDWRRFRPCLRWEFGFTCAFCLLHEADLEEDGSEGAGRMTIEHRIGRSARPAKASVYRNCFLACRHCNEARSRRPTRDGTGRRLLDPVSTAWASRFTASADRLPPVAGDGDAAYTHVAYDLDDERKVRKRRRRRERISGAIETVRDGPRLAALLVDLAATATSAESRRELLAVARALNSHAGMARDELRRYRIVPDDAAPRCACDALTALPTFLVTQGMDVHVD